MTAFKALSTAMVKGFVRDRQAVFFSVFFPLMFLVLFGGLLSNQSTSKLNMVEVGKVTLFHQLPRPARAAFDTVFSVSHSHVLSAAVDNVRSGDKDLAVQQHGNQIVVHFSRADQVKAATVLGTIQSFVQSANVEATGAPPRFTYRAEQVEDKSMTTIQYFTPSLLGWAIAMSASFGAAATLVGWRSTRLLRRIRLAPVSTAAVVGSRVGVTIGIAIVQMLIFLAIAVGAFGLQLSGFWWMAVPLLIGGTLSFMSIGLLAGAIANTQDGASAFVNLVVLPMAFLSGSFFPIDGAPTWLQAVSRVLPLRYLNEGMLDVMVRGQGPGAVAVPLAILVGFAVVVTAIASRFFSWEVA